jgi:hypothetical protein
LRGLAQDRLPFEWFFNVRYFENAFHRWLISSAHSDWSYDQLGSQQKENSPNLIGIKLTIATCSGYFASVTFTIIRLIATVQLYAF